MEHEPRSYEFVPKGKKYLLYVSCRVPVPSWNASKTVKGIDRGTVEPTVVATINQAGVVTSKDCYDTAMPFKSNRAWHQTQQRRLSKMNRHSNRFRRLHAKIRKRLQRVSNRRTYAECIAAKHICDDHSPGMIVLEDLNLSKMTGRGGSDKRHMNREMRFVRHHIIEQRIRSRAEMQGIRVTMVSPRYTSQTCARCSHIDRKSRITRDMFKCTKCNYIQQADINAAIITGRHGLLSSDHTQAVPPEVGTPFVRRELNARLGCFATAGGSTNRRCENQAPAHSHCITMEKQRQRQHAADRSRISTSSRKCTNNSAQILLARY